MVEVAAISKNIRVSAKKVRPVANNFQGQNAKRALESLRFVPRKAATPLAKVLKSAIANAENNNSLSGDKLKIKEISINEGPTFKRFRAVARGAAHPILKRTSHIKIVLEES